MKSVVRPTSTVVLDLLLKHLVGLRKTRWVSVHEVEVRLSIGERVPLRRLKKIS
jgi:hypothetical protein